METLNCPVEVRESETGPQLVGVLIQEGRAASARAEVFAPLSLVWASDGVAVRAEHRGVEVTRAIPTREASGEIRIATPAPPAIVAAFDKGRRFLSIEFHAVHETRSAAGIREIQQAFLPAVALVQSPEYTQATAEIRSTPAPGVAVKFWPWRPWTEVREAKLHRPSYRSDNGECNRGE